MDVLTLLLLVPGLAAAQKLAMDERPAAPGEWGYWSAEGGVTQVNPPKLKLTGRNFTNLGYDPTERAYKLVCQQPGKASTLEFVLAASEESPVVNPALVIENWGDTDAALKINGKEIKRGKDFRVGHEKTAEGTDLIVWVKTHSTKHLLIELAPFSN